MEFSNNINNLKNFSPDGIKAEFASGRQLFVNAGATPQVLASYDSLVKTNLGLPLSRNYSGWTQAQQDAWNKSVLNSGALDQWLGTNLNTKACFFFWLGNKTTLLGKTVPSEFDWGYDLATAQGLAKPGLQKFAQLAGAVRRSSRPCSPRCRPRSRRLPATMRRQTTSRGLILAPSSNRLPSFSFMPATTR